jgi:hypothetical protein
MTRGIPLFSFRRQESADALTGKISGSLLPRYSSLPLLAPGYILTPLPGFQEEAAAFMPLHFLKNVQTPAAPRSGG